MKNRFFTFTLVMCMAAMAIGAPIGTVSTNRTKEVAHEKRGSAAWRSPAMREYAPAMASSLTKVGTAAVEPIEVEATLFQAYKGTLSGTSGSKECWIINAVNADETLQFQFAYSTAEYDLYTTLTEEAFNSSSTYGIDWAKTNETGDMEYIGFAKINMTVSGSENEGTYMDCMYESTDGKVYHITGFQRPAQEGYEEVPITATNLARAFNNNDGSELYFEASNEEYTLVIVLFGTKSGEYERGYFLAGHVDDANQLIQWDIIDGALTLDRETSPMTLKGTVKTGDGKAYVLDLSGDHLLFDVAASDGIETELDNTIEPYIEKGNGFMGLLLQSDDEVLMLTFNVARVGSEIPAGEYTIDYSRSVGTVDANAGALREEILPAFYATLDRGILALSYMLVSGNVTMEYSESGAMHLRMEALNSYGIPVRVKYNQQERTAIEQTRGDTDVVKRIGVDGQLYIERNGQVYSVVGTRIE